MSDVHVYAELAEWLSDTLKTLNDLTKRHDESSGLIPYLGRLPVMLDGEVIGYLYDDIGAAWMFESATTGDIEG